jgi:hypothetical protein
MRGGGGVPFSLQPVYSKTMAAREQDEGSGPFQWNGISIACLAVVSLVYFADIFLKASRKCFWFDELFTVYLCRLSSFTNTWTAVTHGSDFNPPFFYLLIRGAQKLFGGGLIATRLPATIGVWLFCVCLFLFVARRAGAFSGFIAGAFPFFTLIQYYAYEARAHGIILGWCGLALICWQKTKDGRARQLWLAGFGLSLTGALLTHVYAVYLSVPFAAVEVYRLFKRSKPDWDIVAVLVFVPATVILAVYRPLLRAYRTASMPANYFPGSHDLIQRFLIDAVGPATMILILWLLLSVLGRLRHDQRADTEPVIPQREIVAAAGFACIPILGLIGCKVSHGPFLERYFLSSIAGYAILLGFATSGLRFGSKITKTLAGCMFFLMLIDLGTTIYLGIKHRIVLLEPSTGLRLSTEPSDPMALYNTVSLNKSDLDILVLPSLEYIYLFTYAPSSVVSRLYYGAPDDDVNRGGYEKLARWAHVDLKTTTVDQFLATHKRFLLYESESIAHTDEVQSILSAGYRLTSASADVGGVMYDYAK